MTKRLCLTMLFLLGCPGPIELPPAPDAGGEVEPDAGSTVEPEVDAGSVVPDAGIEPPPDAGQMPMPPCAGQAGLFKEQSLEVGGAERKYLLYVPASYSCMKAAPLLFDFHGAYGGTSPPAEEVYTLDGAMAAADRDGFILVRPRSLTVPRGTVNWHYWDATAEDVPKNLALVRALLVEVSSRYHVAEARVYALGFSNGTQMALRLLAEPQPIIHGAAIVGGGYWTQFPLPSSLADRGRTFVVTGYRDYHYTLGVPPLKAALGTHAYPMDRYLERPAMSGHELLAWQYPEAFAWLDRGEKPAAPGALPQGWTEMGFDGASPLAVTTGDAPWLGSGIGAAWRLEANHAEVLPALPASTPSTGICVTPSGAQLATVKDHIARRPAGAAAWTLINLPVSTSDPVAMAVDIICLPSGRVVVGGFSGFGSDDDGLTWQPVFMGFPGYGSAQVNRLHRTASGAVIAAGDYYLGRSLDGVAFGVRASFEARYYAATSFGTSVWAAGTSGRLAKSTDDGVSWTPSSLGPDVDVYDLAAVSANVVVAVGARGLMLVTRDGGATWSRVETGQTGMLVCVRRSGSALDRLTVFGEGGRSFELPAP